MFSTLSRLALNGSLTALLAAGFSPTALAQFVLLPDPETTGALPVQRPLPIAALERFPEMGALKIAADSYRRGDLAAGDAVAARISNAETRIAAEWVAIRTAGRSVGFDRLNRFIQTNPDIPMQRWLQRKAEDALIIERARGDKVLAFFAARPPESANGRAALASAKALQGDTSAAQRLALEAYRDRILTRDVAEFLEKLFPEVLTPQEKILRAHRLIQNNQRAEGLRLASGFGDDQLKLAQALAAAQAKGESAQPLDAVPPALRNHSSFRLAQAQILRRQDRLDEAFVTLVRSPRDASQLADPDEWWTERRVLVRRLLDANDAAGAYRIAAEHAAVSAGRRAEAEFHAGWIALRYLGYAQTAMIHFDESARLAELTAAKSRAAYWRGRAFEAGALGDGTDRAAFETAAAFPATYYGQLAAGRLGREALHLPVTEASDADEAMVLASPAGQLIQRLLDAGLKELAVPLAIDFARTAPSASHVDAIARRFVAMGDAPTVLNIGKLATARGLALEHHAFPTFGIPGYQPLPGSQDKAMVYAIARQESAFNAKAVSHADARGLMQMLPSTASRTASRFKVPFSPDRLTAEPAFNAMLGAAHLGELMEETKGSIVMTFASYNAGGGRVREWVQAFGDPRQPGVDIVDWVERIPFYETRHYVQKIMENYQVYRARFTDNRSALMISEDMERGRRP
jgi:soluble lytic murein transglycosylase